MITNQKNIIFDLDGVVIDSNPSWTRGVEQFTQELGVPKGIPFELRKKMHGMRVFEAVTLLKAKFGFKPKVDDLMDRIDAIMRNLHAEKTTLFPGTRDLLSELEANHFTTALATSSTRSLTEYVLSRFNLKPYFDYVTTGEDVLKSKPDPEIFLLTAAHMQKDPKDCIVVEDSLLGLQAAKDAGMDVIAVSNNGDFDPEEITQIKPTHVVKDLSDIDLGMLG
ncbi:HAD family phosphatase [Patescibacteria group bacterium]|nr:HAD family phosphatase [Patescibacteria group bacterium]